MTLNSFDDIKHCLYINLEHRTDRRELIENELTNLNIPYQRFNAIRHQKGEIGVGLSQTECLKIAKRNNWEHVMIVEDDIQFQNIKKLKENTNKFLNSGIDWDVLMLSGLNDKPFTKISDYALKVHRCGTAGCYIIKRYYYDTLIKKFTESVELMKMGKDTAIDVYWYNLQERDNWFLIIPLTVVQRNSFSDIRGNGQFPLLRPLRFKIVKIPDVISNIYLKIIKPFENK